MLLSVTDFKVYILNEVKIVSIKTTQKYMLKSN